MRPDGQLPRLVFVTQTVDEDHAALGRVVGMVRALGERSRLTVIANEVGRVPVGLPAAVLSLGKEAGAGRLTKTARYLRLLRRLAREQGGCDGLIAHMCPEYLVLAAPTCRRHGIGTFLWYTHPYAGRRLRVAERLADQVITSVEGSYPGRSRRVNVIGHAIDGRQFPPRPFPARPPTVLLALGRTSPVKNLPLLLEAVARTAEDVRLRVVGPSSTPQEVAHRAELEALVTRLGMAEAVTVEDAVPATAVAELVASCHAVVNTTRSGSADKVVFEALAAGRPVVTTNTAFRGVLRDAPDLLVAPEPAALAARLDLLAALPDSDLEDLGLRLRETVLRDHSTGHWADEVVRLVERGAGA